MANIIKIKYQLTRVCSMAGMICAAVPLACSPVLEVSTPKAVMISNVSDYNKATALRMAEAECSKQGAHAVEVPDNVRDGYASYECKAGGSTASGDGPIGCSKDTDCKGDRVCEGGRCTNP